MPKDNKRRCQSVSSSESSTSDCSSRLTSLSSDFSESDSSSYSFDSSSLGSSDSSTSSGFSSRSSGSSYSKSEPCSSKSESRKCCKPPTCEKKCCQEEPRKCLSPEILACELQNAVVQIHSEFIFLGQTGGIPFTGATGGTPLAANGRADVIVEGNGYFIKGEKKKGEDYQVRIITASHLVLAPPSLTSVANRYPLLDPTNTTLGQIKNQMIRASRVLVSVFNVNNKGDSYVYEADIWGIDGAGNIVELRINPQRAWNRCNPPILPCHPFLELECSAFPRPGEKAYLIGDPITNGRNLRSFNAVGFITEGVVQDPKYLDYSGFILHESLVVSTPAYAFSAGMPILNCEGKVIGMQTADVTGAIPRLNFNDLNVGDTIVGGATETQGLGGVGGPSARFMNRILHIFRKGICSKKYACHLETICDPAGAYLRYKKAYAGLGYDVFTGVEYDVTVDYTSGAAPSGQPRIRLDSYGNFLNSPTCKELSGIRVLGIAGLNPNDLIGITNGYWYVPGGTGTAPLPASLPISPFFGKLLPGDVITHIEGSPIGDLKGQIAPSLITWRLCAGRQLEICYRRGGNVLNTADNSLTENYEGLYSYTVCLGDFPYLLDYPWYAVNYFPLLAQTPYPGFSFPITQITNPQFPQLFAGAPFRPAF